MQKALLEAKQKRERKESKEFDAVKKVIKQNSRTQNMKGSGATPPKICKYHSTLHEPTRCPAYSKSWAGCGRSKHFEWMCRSASGIMMTGAVREKHREVHDMCHDVEEIKVSTEEFDTIKSKVFNFSNMQSVIITRLILKLVKELKYVTTG